MGLSCLSLAHVSLLELLNVKRRRVLACSRDVFRANGIGSYPWSVNRQSTACAPRQSCGSIFCSIDDRWDTDKCFPWERWRLPARPQRKECSTKVNVFRISNAIVVKCSTLSRLSVCWAAMIRLFQDFSQNKCKQGWIKSCQMLIWQSVSTKWSKVLVWWQVFKPYQADTAIKRGILLARHFCSVPRAVTKCSASRWKNMN